MQDPVTMTDEIHVDFLRDLPVTLVLWICPSLQSDGLSFRILRLRHSVVRGCSPRSGLWV